MSTHAASSRNNTAKGVYEESILVVLPMPADSAILADVPLAHRGQGTAPTNVPPPGTNGGVVVPPPEASALIPDYARRADLPDPKLHTTIIPQGVEPLGLVSMLALMGDCLSGWLETPVDVPRERRLCE